MKIVTVVGARPQFIKASAISRTIESLRKKGKRIEEILVHTGQHYDDCMDKVFFEELRLPKPNYHLGVGSGSHARQTGIMLDRIETILEKEKPDLVMVYGDTNSTLAGALAAAKLSIPVAHVEAGLRSYNRSMPEEINRILTDHLSTFLFCPTTQSVKNLQKEGIRDRAAKIVRNVGDVMYDSILYYSKIAEQKSTILEEFNLFNPQSLPTGALAQAGAIRHAPRRVHGCPEPLMVQGEPRTPNYYLATLHRAENTDHPKRLKSILRGLNEIAKDISVILPLHPRTKKMVEVYHLGSAAKKIKLVEPVSYLNMLKLEKNARAIFTDSGGVQKEAYWFRVPCFTLRNETEWVETIESGWNTLVGTGMRIAEEVRRGIRRKRPLRGKKIFGDGKASEKIVELLMNVKVEHSRR